MKTNFFILILIIALGYGIMLAADNFLKPPPTGADGTRRGQIGEQAPPFAFKTFDGTYFSMADVKGKVILLNFWASWCAPCRKEFPDLLRIAANNKDVVLVALSSDTDEQAAQQFIITLKEKHRFPKIIERVYIGIDEGQKITSGVYQTYKLPETLIIGPEFEIREKLVGASWTREELETIINGARTSKP